ncbi:type II secretion system F family protein [Roseibium salinum]|nr:type II secretion system F family protein [Roseibium salinum]
MTRSLAAGHPLPTSIALVAREMPDPIGSEFGMLSDELTYGTDITDSMRNMVERVGADDLKLVAISMTVQRGTGGNLGEILSNLSDVLRHRQLIKAKIKSLSAEGRMTSWIMLAFPFFLYLMISTLAPGYFDPIWDSGYGNIVIMVGLVIMAVGMLILRKLVNFDF